MKPTTIPDLLNLVNGKCRETNPGMEGTLHTPPAQLRNEIPRTHHTLQRWGRFTTLALLVLPLWLAHSWAMAQVLDDFDDNRWQAWRGGVNGGVLRWSWAETDQQFKFAGEFNATNPNGLLNTWMGAWPSPRNTPIQSDQPLELRMDLVGASQTNAFAWLGWDGQPGALGYSFMKDQDELVLWKYGNNRPFLFWENQTIKNSNVTMVLAFDYQSPNLLITTKVLDKDADDQVLFERTFTDTPNRDPVVTDLPTRNLVLEEDDLDVWTGDGLMLIGYWQYGDGPTPWGEVALDNVQINGELIDDFDDNVFYWRSGSGRFQTTFTETNQQLTVISEHSDPISSDGRSTIAGALTPDRAWQVPPGEPQEVRVDLVGANQDDAFARIGWLGSGRGGYFFAKDRNELFLKKSETDTDVYFFWENLEIKNENVVLAFRTTRVDGDLIIHTRVLDKDNDNEVLFERVVRDTPNVDPTVSPPPEKGLLSTYTTDPGPPYETGDPDWFILGVWQYTDGTQPPAVVTFDNLESGPMRPNLRITRSMTGTLLSWREDPFFSFALEERAHLEADSWRLAPSGRTNPAARTADETSQFFRLINVAPLRFIQPPEPLQLDQGTSGSFSALATGVSDVQYQWYFNGTEMPGETDAVLNISDAQPGDEGDYSVLITDDLGSISSDPVTLTVLVRPTIVEHPQSKTVRVGDSVTFSVRVTNTANLPIGYRWRKNSTTLTTMVLESHVSTYTINDVLPADAATYRVVVTNAAFVLPGFQSDPAILTVEEE